MTRHLTADCQVPVFHRDALAHPAHDVKRKQDVAIYAPLSGVLSEEWSFDAHYAAYSLPSVERRLATDAALDLGPEMVAFVVDVDGPDHQRTPEWWAAEQEKVARLAEDHPLPFVYATKGGYRLVYTLRHPVKLASVFDAARWSASYVAWLDLLDAQYGIVGDYHQAPWTALYRAPDVVRAGERQRHDVVGDESAIGVWSLPLVEESAVTTPVAGSDDYEVPDFLPPDADKLDRAALALAKAWPKTGRRFATLALCGGLARQGWPVDEIAGFVAGVCELAEPGNADFAKRHRAARSSVAKVESGLTTTGWPALASLLGDAAVTEAREALGFTAAPAADEAFRAMLHAAIARPRLAREAETPETAEDDEPLAPVGDDGDAPLSHDYTLAHYKLLLPKLKRSKQADALVDARYLSRLFDTQIKLQRHGDPAEDLLLKLAVALVRRAPERADVAVLETLLLRYAPRADARAALDRALAVQPLKEPDAPGSTDKEGFVVSTIGPSSGQRLARHLPNLELALSRMDTKFRYDQFANKTVVSVGAANEQIVGPANLNEVWFAIDQFFRFQPPDDYYRKAIDYIARRDGFHPVVDHFSSLVWDGVRRVGGPSDDDAPSWLTTYGGAKDTRYVRAVGRLVLVAAVRRVRQPGCKFDEMLVLESAQGKFKSSALAVLAIRPEWFTDSLVLDGNQQRTMEALAGHLIVEAGELKGHSKSETGTLKALLSRTVDECRMPYEREPERRPRQCVVIATTNEKVYLRDPTGDRRVWPVEVEEFAIEALRADVAQIWAEAAHYESLGESIRLHPSLYADAAAEQDARHATDTFEDVLTEALGDVVGHVKVCDVWTLLGITQSLATPQQTTRLREVMTRGKWQRGRRRFGGQRIYTWERGDQVEREVPIRLEGTRRVTTAPGAVAPTVKA